MKLIVNNQRREVTPTDPQMPLLWVLREQLQLTGTKFGCGAGLCGACTVHVDGAATRSCLLPCSTLANRRVDTIEALANDPIGAALQRAWVEYQVPQCGYCQSGMLMAATALLREKRRPSDADIAAAITNLCRCGTYARVKTAIHAAAEVIA